MPTNKSLKSVASALTTKSKKSKMSNKSPRSATGSECSVNLYEDEKTHPYDVLFTKRIR